MTVSIANMTSTWTYSNTAYTGIGMNVNTNSTTANANSRIIDLKVNGTTKFAVDANSVVYLKTVTVANLPNAVVSGAGARAFVTDSSVVTFNTNVSGGGSNKIPVFSDGTNWKVG